MYSQILELRSISRDLASSSKTGEIAHYTSFPLNLIEVFVSKLFDNDSLKQNTNLLCNMKSTKKADFYSGLPLFSV